MRRGRSRAAPLGAVFAALALAAPPAAWARSIDCYSAASALGAREWVEAERTLRANLALEDCVAVREELRYSLAYAIEVQAKDAPARACEAEALYGTALDALSDDALKTAAAGGRERMAATCGCQPPEAELAAGAWSEAVAGLEARERAPACAPFADTLRLARARALEAWAGTVPDKACPAADLFEVLADAEGSAPDLAARGRALRRVCADLERDLGSDPRTPTDSEQSDPTPLLLGISAGVAALAGGGLIYAGVEADGERAAAEARFVAAHNGGAVDAKARAAEDFAEAGDRATALGIAGWGSLAVAVGLGVAALAMLPPASTPTVSPTVGPEGVGAIIRF